MEPYRSATQPCVKCTIFHINACIICVQAALVQAVEDAGFEAMLLSSGGLQTLHLHIGGMTCGACSASVEKALLMQAGVSRAAVNVVTGTAEVWFNNSLSGG